MISPATAPAAPLPHAPVERQALITQMGESMAGLARVWRAQKSIFGSGIPGLDAGLVPVLLALEAGSARVSDLADQVCSDVSTVSRQVSGLVSGGFASKQADDQDRRALRIALTPAGQQAVRALREARGEWLRHHLEDWTDEDIAILIGFFDRLIATGRAFLGEDQPTQP